ncbi:MAG: hypothetical protein O9253_00885 [Aquidulcibacter sp.]|nr:hypothetical protein [Aquidulcibacter sp.]
MAEERTRSAGGLCVIGWGHGSGLIATFVEAVGLGSDDGCAFNRTGATSYEGTIFTDPSHIFAPTHDRRHDLAGVPR